MPVHDGIITAFFSVRRLQKTVGITDLPQEILTDSAHRESISCEAVSVCELMPHFSQVLQARPNNLCNLSSRALASTVITDRHQGVQNKQGFCRVEAIYRRNRCSVRLSP